MPKKTDWTPEGLSRAVEKGGQLAFPSWADLCRYDNRPGCDAAFVSEIARAKALDRSLTESIARYITRHFLKDPAYHKFADFTWPEVIDIFADMVSRNRGILARYEIDDDDLQPVSGESAESAWRPFGQLPCTRATATARVEKAKALCGPADPILLVGDDDLVSVELARTGFRDISVVDIDMDVLAEIASEAREGKLPLRLHLHDLTQPPPPEAVGDYRLVFLDPHYSVGGVRLFLEGALRLTRAKPGTLFFLSVHLMSLRPSGVDEALKLFAELGLEVKGFFPAFNSYPIPKYLRLLITLVNRGVLRVPALLSAGGGFPFFTSDAVLLEKK